MAVININEVPRSSTMLDQSEDPRSSSSPINPVRYQVADPMFQNPWASHMTASFFIQIFLFLLYR